MAKANVILLNSILWNLREICKLADEIKKQCGDVDCTSWRYPLIACSELKILKLIQSNRNLDNYTFILELTYDRLLYVFNLIIKYMESQDCLKKFRPERNVFRPKSLSLASVLCMMWDRIQAQMDIINTPNCQSEDKTIIQDQCDSEVCVKISKSTTCTQSELSSISVCSCCEMVQEFVTKLIFAIEKVLEKHDCESAITAERKSMKETLVEMTNWSAMFKWLEAIIKDFNTISEKSEKETLSSRKLRSRIDSDEKKMKIKVEQYEEEIRLLGTKLRDHESKISLMKDEMNNLIKEKNRYREKVKAKNAQITDVTSSYQNKILNLKKNHENEILQHKEKANRERCETEREWNTKLEEEIKNKQIIEAEVQKLSEALTKASEDHSVLAEEKISLRNKCQLLEKELENLRNENFNMKSIITQKQYVIDDYSRRITEAFPQLSDTSKTAYKASGNPEIDMANQIEANNIRMELLSNENENLQRALNKMKALKGE